MKIEAIFGGILALLILGVAGFVIVNTSFDGPKNTSPAVIASPSSAAASAPDLLEASDLICQCYDQGRELAGTGVGVMSSQYRSGFEQCRAVKGVKGGDAWTAGWNARLSAKPYEASCRRYKKSGR